MTTQPRNVLSIEPKEALDATSEAVKVEKIEFGGVCLNKPIELQAYDIADSGQAGCLKVSTTSQEDALNGSSKIEVTGVKCISKSVPAESVREKISLGKVKLDIGNQIRESRNRARTVKTASKKIQADKAKNALYEKQFREITTQTRFAKKNNPNGSQSYDVWRLLLDNLKLDR